MRRIQHDRKPWSQLETVDVVGQAVVEKHAISIPASISQHRLAATHLTVITMVIWSAKSKIYLANEV